MLTRRKACSRGKNPFHMNRHRATSSFLFISSRKIKVNFVLRAPFAWLFGCFGMLRVSERKELGRNASKVFSFFLSITFCSVVFSSRLVSRRQQMRKRWRNVIFHHMRRRRPRMGESALINYSRRVSITREETKDCRLGQFSLG